MTTFPNAPRLLKAGLVLVNTETSAVERVIALQYNPQSLSRTLQVQDVVPDGGDRSQAMRLKGPPVETLTLEAVIDATDQLEFPDDNSDAVELGIHPQLAALETIVYPTSEQLQSNDALARSGTLEIAPMETPIALFIWSRSRILPVRVTEYSVTEEAFDPSLNPIRARVTLGMRVLTVDDLGFSHRGGSLFMSYLQRKEGLAAKGLGGVISTLGIGELP